MSLPQQRALSRRLTRRRRNTSRHSSYRKRVLPIRRKRPSFCKCALPPAGQLEAPKHLARSVHDWYFEPKSEDFRPRTIWSLSNAFTPAFKELDPIPQFKATAKLGEFLEARFSQSF